MSEDASENRTRWKSRSLDNREYLMDLLILNKTYVVTPSSEPSHEGSHYMVSMRNKKSSNTAFYLELWKGTVASQGNGIEKIR